MSCGGVARRRLQRLFTAQCALRDKLANAGFLQLLTAGSSAGGASGPAAFVVTIYRILQQPNERLACLEALFEGDDVGNDERQLMLRHLRQLHPSAFGGGVEEDAPRPVLGRQGSTTRLSGNMLGSAAVSMFKKKAGGQQVATRM